MVKTKDKSEVKRQHFNIFHAICIHPISDYSSLFRERVSIAVNPPIKIDIWALGIASKHRSIPESAQTDISLTHGLRTVNEGGALAHPQSAHTGHGHRALAVGYQAIV